MWIIYCHKNKINNKIYIGQTKKTLEQRSQSNGTGYKKCLLFWRAIEKYGWQNFSHIILDKAQTQEEADKKEKYYIQLYNSNNKQYGYNLTNGGEGVSMPMSEETKRKISQATKGKNNPFYGKHHTEESKQKIRDHMKNISGENNPFYGKHHTEESKQKISQAKKRQGAKKIYCITTNEIFNSIKQATQKYNINPATISAVCNHKPNRKSAGKHPITGEKMEWRFLNEE